MQVICETFEVGNNLKNLRVNHEACAREIGGNKISETAEAQGLRYSKYYPFEQKYLLRMVS